MKKQTKKTTAKKVTRKMKQYVAIVLDESGSMNCIRKEAIDHFNEQIQTLKKNKKNDVVVSFITFNDKSKVVYENEELKNVEEITEKEYSPSGCTAMYDAMGFAITNLSKNKDITKKNVSVLVLTISDGDENSSTDYNKTTLGKLIEEKTALKNWTFAYMGANHDVTQVSQTLNIPIGNTTIFTSTHDGMGTLITTSNVALRSYSTSLNVDNASTDSYFSNKDLKEK